MNKLKMKIGNKMDMFFVIEDEKIYKIFYNKTKCNMFIEEENKKRENE